jgi:hypothetical protein
MYKGKRGSSAVEFALLCPLITIVVSGLLFIAQLGIRQIFLTHEAVRLARRLSLMPDENAKVNIAARYWAPTTIHIEKREIPSVAPIPATRSAKHVYVVSVTLEQTVRFFGWVRPLVAHASEAGAWVHP